MRKSPLHEVHARLTPLSPYEGMELPSVFTDTDAEIEAGLDKVAMTDRSFYDRVLVKGNDRADLLHRITTNDLLKNPTIPHPTIFTNEKGRVIEYAWVVPRPADLLLIVSPGAARRLITWVERFIIMEDVTLEDISDSTGIISFIGPSSSEVQLVGGEGLTVVPTSDFHSSIVNVIGNADQLGLIWKSSGVPFMGWRAFDQLRVARGIPMPGREISDRFNPYDIGLLHAVSYTKGCYIGQEVIARLDTYGKSTKSLFGIRFATIASGVEESAPVRKGDEEVGVLTSISRGSGAALGLGVLKKELSAGTHVSVGGATGTVEILPMSLSQTKS